MPIFRGFSTNKKAVAFCNCLITRAESGTRTRDLFITSETLYHLSYFGTVTDVDSAISGAKIQRGMQNAKFKMQNCD